MARSFVVAASVALGVGVLWAGGCSLPPRDYSSSADAGGGGAGGTGGAAACKTAADCGAATPCGQPSCSMEGTCVWEAQAPDMAMPAGLTNVYGDCKRQYCMGGEVVTSDPENADVYVYGNPCFTPDCQAGGNMSPAANAGATCQIDANTTGKCNGSARCVECLVAGDCASNMCQNGTCVTDATCGDGTLSGDETDVDCGGSCAPCALGLACGVFLDCESKRCIGGQCVSECFDSLKNGNETDADCGGPNCDSCLDGKSCNYATDCASGRCEGGVCMPPQ